MPGHSFCNGEFRISAIRLSDFDCFFELSLSPSALLCYTARLPSGQDGRSYALSEFTYSDSAEPVVVIGFEMPFWSLVRFLVKLAFASIPAGIIVALIYAAIGVSCGFIWHFLHGGGHLLR